MTRISDMPAEVLFRIFTLCTPNLRNWNNRTTRRECVRLINYTHVCSAWRKLALASPLLWTCPTPMNRQLTEEMICRAGSVPLVLRILANSDIGPHYYPLRSAINGLARNTIARMRYLNITGMKTELTWGTLVRENLKLSQLVSLEVLILCPLHTQPFPSGVLTELFHASHNLRRLTVGRMPPPLAGMSPALSLTFLHLEYERIGSPHFPLTDLASFLTKTPSVKELHLKLAIRVSGLFEPTAPVDVQVELGHLERLSIYGNSILVGLTLAFLSWTPDIFHSIRIDYIDDQPGRGPLPTDPPLPIIHPLSTCLHTHSGILELMSNPLDSLNVSAAEHCLRTTHILGGRQLQLVHSAHIFNPRLTMSVLAALATPVPTSAHCMFTAHGQQNYNLMSTYFGLLVLVHPTSSITVELQGSKATSIFLTMLDEVITSQIPTLKASSIDSIIIGRIDWGSIGPDCKAINRLTALPAAVILRNFLEYRRDTGTPVRDMTVYISKTRSAVRQIQWMEDLVERLNLILF